MTAYPASPAQFRRAAEAAFRRANPDADVVGLALTWKWSRRITFPTGIAGFSGSFTATAPGFRTRDMIALADRESGISVR